MVFNVDLTFDFPMDNMLLYKIYDTINQLYHLDTTAIVVLEEFSQDDAEAAALEMEAMEEDLLNEIPLEDKVEEDFVEDADLEEFIDDEDLDKETRKAREKERKAREKERKQRAKEREKELKKQAKEREKALKEAQEKREQLAKDAENALKEKERIARNNEKTSVVTLDSVSLIYYPQANSFLADDSIVVSSMCGNKLNVKMAAKVLVNLNEPSATIFLQVDEHLWYYFRYEGEYVEMLANTDSFNYRLDDMKEKDRIFTDKKTGCRLGYGVSDYYYVEEFLNFVKNLEK